MTGPRRPTLGFTLLEVVLAIALSAVLMALLTMAINQYLLNVQSSRVYVEHAQVARGVMRMIAADLRNASVAVPQNIKAAEELSGFAAAANFDPESVDDPSELLEQNLAQTEPVLSGVSGDMLNLQVDVARVRRDLMTQPEEVIPAVVDELLFEGPPTTSGVSRVRYSVAPQGGLVRQEIAQEVALWDEQQASTLNWDAAYQMVAEEVQSIQFRYSDGSQSFDTWDLVEQETSPVAVEVTLTLDEPTRRATQDRNQSPRTRTYRMVVATPMVGPGYTPEETASAEQDAAADPAAEL